MATSPSSPRNFFFSFPFYLLCLLPVQVLSCGMSTHIDIGHQAINWFKDARNNTDYREIILKNQDAFIAGNPYPDAMYSSLCYSGRFHSISEDTHWAPFLNATVNYIRKKYPKPWDQETEKLVAFTLGFVSHQVADVTWHSLGITQGFLTTMGDVNFFGSFSAAHPVGDIGGDMVASFEGDTSQLPSGFKEWYLPSRDLEEIYLEYYGEKKITREEIEICSATVLLAWIGEQTAGAKLVAEFSKQSPFLVEDFHTYFQGGVADMAGWSVILWHRTIDMLEHGTGTCTIPKSPLFINCNKTDRFVTQLKEAQLKENLKNPGTVLLRPGVHKKVNLSDINIRQSERGSYFSFSKSFKSKIKKDVKGMSKSCFECQKSHPRVTVHKNKADEGMTTTYVQYSSSVPYARAGWSLVYGNFSGTSLSLVVGAPGYGIPGNSQNGRIYLVTSNTQSGLPDKDLNLDSNADMIIDGTVENGRFGTALAVVDLNRDGIDDLAVSAPSTGANALQYLGTVYVFYGLKQKELSLQPSLTIHGNETYYNLGTSLLGADVDSDGFKDLIIGSPYAPEGGPQRGSVAVFLAKTKRKPGAEITVHEADWLHVGEQNYSWFGSSLTVADITGRQFLLVGAPTFRLCAYKNCSYSKDDIQSVGKVYVFQISQLKSLQPLATITGTETFMKLGTALAVGNPYNADKENANDIMLAVSASTQSIEGSMLHYELPIEFDQAGAVYIINLTTVLRLGKDVTLTDIKYNAVFEGDRSFARYGWSLSLTDINQDGIKDLLFSAPFRTNDLTEEIHGAEEGGLFIFYGRNSFPSGNATRNCLEVDPCPEEKASMMVKSFQERSRLGSTFVSITTPNPTTNNLVISSPRSSSEAFHAGSVHVIHLTKNRGKL